MIIKLIAVINMIIKLINSPVDEIKIGNMTMQLQIGESDCGIILQLPLLHVCTAVILDGTRAECVSILSAASSRKIWYPFPQVMRILEHRDRQERLQFILCIVNV